MSSFLSHGIICETHTYNTSSCIIESKKEPINSAQ